MSRWTALLLAVGLSVACSHRSAVGPVGEPESAVEAVRGRPVPFALQARFSVRVEGPGIAGSTVGGLVMHRPGRLRLELLTPLATPMLYVATDGVALNAYQWDQRVFYRGDDALAVLHELTGGSVSGDDVVAILTGGLPLPGAEVLSVASDGHAHLDLELAAPAVAGDVESGEVLLRALVDERRNLVDSLSLVRRSESDETTLATARYLDYVKEGRSRLPGELEIELPTLGWRVWLEFTEWDEMGQIPDVFRLSAPAGATEADLVTTLRDLAERRRNTPAP